MSRYLWFIIGLLSMITVDTAMQATTLSNAFGHLTDPRVNRTKQYALHRYSDHLDLCRDLWL
ncbi:hypothetical protein; putative exported protein [Xenorhabdus nematophila ATCC 19061]|uniref:Uncharacterized protein n=1 Tax=Xenorhabdus nematophila (strain ATCC 19061 / DSM 3370 / CCUG 14189 / LMG 1036 / NCIMB 9965 / AN6) TaxID=406817 RepID=D3VDR0_XENNA|nr:hypothetical protein; putative exported protein [Xenorhabdus nematophila ATCC 19061]